METKNQNSPTIKILKREFQRITHRKTIYIISIFLPIILFTLFAMIYKNELVRKVPVAVCDQDHSVTSRLLTRYLESSSAMTIAATPRSVDEIRDLFYKGKIQGAFFIPRNMEEDLKNGTSVSVIVFKGTSNLITSNYIYNDGVKICKTVSAGVVLKKFKSAGFKDAQAMNMVNPVRVQSQILFNPNYSYENYLVPGLMTVVLQMIIMVVAALLISSEITHDTFKELIAIANNRILPIIIGKTIPHLLIHFATSMMILGIFFTVFNIPVEGSVLFTLLFLLFFVLASFFYGFFLSTIFSEQQMATEAVLFINTPAFIFSGFTFPLWGMPLVHQIYAQTIPYTHFLTGFLKLYQMNSPVEYAVPEILRLSAFLIVSLIGIAIMLKLRIRKTIKLSVKEPGND